MELKADGSLLVRAPLRMSTPRIRRFVEDHRGWIEMQLQKRAALPAAQKLSADELAALRKTAKCYFARRAACYAPLLGVSFGQIRIRCQKTKWGSCSAKGNLNFNLLLMLAPEAVRDYVVVHELCHLLEMNHSARFWQNVERVLPDYASRRKWLKDHGLELMARVY